MKKCLKNLMVLMLLCLMAAPATVCAQNYHTKSKKAVNYFKKAKKQYDEKKYFPNDCKRFSDPYTCPSRMS